jgi:hypothetical protein
MIRLPPGRLAAALLLAAALSGGALRAAEPEPFYLDLERSAALALERGDAAAAARKFRLACFGLLDEPPRLAACLVRLGVAQGRGGDREGFEATFERLDAVEGRFEVYAAAPVEPALREEFEGRLVAWIAARTLAARPAFAPLAERREAPAEEKSRPRRRNRD